MVDFNRKLFTEQDMEDVGEFFRRCPGLTFIFLARIYRYASAIGPDMISALALASAALLDSGYEPPYADYEYEDWGSDAIPKSQVADAIQTRVQELKFGDADFLLIWNLSGTKDVHVEGDLSEVRRELVSLMQFEVAWYLD